MHAGEETGGRDILGVHGRLVSAGVLEVRRGNHGRGMSRLAVPTGAVHPHAWEWATGIGTRKEKGLEQARVCGYANGK